ncbi:MAG: hypothetical protein NTV56_03235 [Alphaproteobacteria bacterium]|nr:hypothetical protein [Alphaproteobacteria bacterium]
MGDVMRLTSSVTATALIWAGLTIQAPAQTLTAIVEDVRGGPAGVEFMDYVKPGRVIQLGSNGKIVIGYLKSCWRETITGGKVTIGTGWSEVSGGKVDRTQIACDGGKMQLTYEVASKSGASVFRDIHRAEQPTLADASRPQFVLHGLSPIVEVKRGSSVVIERIDNVGERYEIPGPGKIVHGRFYDFADDNKQLTAAGTYRVTVGKQLVVFKVDNDAKPGKTPIAGRLLRLTP